MNGTNPGTAFGPGAGRKLPGRQPVRACRQMKAESEVACSSFPRRMMQKRGMSVSFGLCLSIKVLARSPGHGQGQGQSKDTGRNSTVGVGRGGRRRAYRGNLAGDRLVGFSPTQQLMQDWLARWLARWLAAGGQLGLIGFMSSDNNVFRRPPVCVLHKSAICVLLSTLPPLLRLTVFYNLHRPSHCLLACLPVSAFLSVCLRVSPSPVPA